MSVKPNLRPFAVLPATHDSASKRNRYVTFSVFLTGDRWITLHRAPRSRCDIASPLHLTSKSEALLPQITEIAKGRAIAAARCLGQRAVLPKRPRKMGGSSRCIGPQACDHPIVVSQYDNADVVGVIAHLATVSPKGRGQTPPHR